MEAAYTSVYLWKNTVEKANSFAVKDIQDNADGVTFQAPEGLVTIDGDNHHITKTARIGRNPFRRTDLHGLGFGTADRAGSVPEELPLG